MKKVFIILLTFCLCLGLCGCSSWMDGSYHSVTPHPPEKVDAKQDTVTIDSEDQLMAALTGQIEQGSASTVIYCRNGDEEQLRIAMNAAIQRLSETNGIFAYAVDDILYEIGQRNAQTAISVQITYLHGKQEIETIRQVPDVQAASLWIAKALDACDAGVVLRIEKYSDMDIAQFVQDYVEENPQTCMEMPQVTAMLYPESGTDRVMELTFTYQTSRDALRNMQDIVQPVFSSAKNYVNAEADRMEQYFQLYSFLMGRDTYTVQTSLTPSYSLLNHGVGDSKAFATVYAAMCRQSGLDCQVVSGTREGMPWCWNVAKIDNQYSYLDLLWCSENGGFQLRTSEQMDNYVWDYSAY